MGDLIDDFDDDDDDDGDDVWDKQGDDEPIQRLTSIYDQAEAKVEKVEKPETPAMSAAFITLEQARTAAANSTLDSMEGGASSYYKTITKPKTAKVKTENAEKWWVKAARKNIVFQRDYEPSSEGFPNGIVPKLQNVVATTQLGCRFNLRAVATKLPNCEYDPRKRNGCCLRIRHPRCTATLFPTGQLRCMGSKTEFHALAASRKFARKLQKLDYPIKFNKFRVTNVMATVDVGFGLRSLEGFATQYENEGAHYEPDQFPGVRYESASPKATVQIFASGKLTFLSAKNRRSVYVLFKKLYPKLLGYAVARPAPAPPKTTSLHKLTTAITTSSSTSTADPVKLEMAAAGIKMEPAVPLKMEGGVPVITPQAYAALAQFAQSASATGLPSLEPG